MPTGTPPRSSRSWGWRSRSRRTSFRWTGGSSPPVTPGWRTGPTHPDDLAGRYRGFYAGHPFVEVVDAPPGMRAVQRTNFAQVCAVPDPRGGRLTVFGVIDNLGKGAAGQALQNLNLMAGLPETEGLL